MRLHRVYPIFTKLVHAVKNTAYHLKMMDIDACGGFNCANIEITLDISDWLCGSIQKPLHMQSVEMRMMIAT